ncbi:DUF2142 domain-containing protein [Flaviflexus equikiangi]|uniref:DUF2142 domain-containing protein n=1 Tax=Flaviflexus equikiangi TaxID=2758573 RepID=A0ABS2THW0_9ACTO|nr:DUF2142 domain-containing protein [Flaviflexus equikiangi]MBM9433867.1 DUF2142 domain-containing protein [Flaviflexus equikiangi]
MRWQRDRQRLIGAGALLTVVYLAFLIAWAYATPAFRSPDAPMHYNSVMRVMEGGGWPEPGEADIDPAVLTVAIEGGLVAAGAPDLGWGHFYRLNGGLIVGTGQYLADTDPLPEAQRSIPQFTGEGSVGVDQMTQHPPLYYGIAAGFLTMLGADSWQWDGQLLALSILSALMVMWVVPCTIYTARRLGLNRRLSLLAGASILAVPQLAHIGSAVTNDSLYILMGSLLIAACAKVLTTTPTRRDVIMVGALLGLGLWTKGTFVGFGLVAGLSFLASRGALPWTRKLKYGVSAGLLGVLVGGYWWVRNLVLYGVLQPSGFPNEAADWAGVEPRFSDFLALAWTDLMESFWGKFGWLELPLPSALIIALTLIALIMSACGLAAAREYRIPLLVLVLFVPLTIAVLTIQGWLNYQHTGEVSGMQGRYPFPGIVALAVLVSWGHVWLRRVGGPRLAQASESLFAIGSPLVGLIGLWTMLRAAYSSDSLLGFSWMTWDAWSIATGATLKLSVIVCVLGSAIIMVGGLRLAAMGAKAPAESHRR